MKTTIRKSLVLVALFVSAAVSYGNEISSNVNNGKGVRTTVTFKDVKKGSILSIKDVNGLVLYKEAIQLNGSYTKGFDLTSLPDGNYYFEMDKDVEVKIIPFKVVASVVTFNKTSEESIFKPVVFMSNNNYVHVSQMAVNNKVLSVEIYAENGDQIYSEKIEKEGDVLGKIYDFSTSAKGVYTFVMKTNGRRFVQNLDIKKNYDQ